MKYKSIVDKPLPTTHVHHQHQHLRQNFIANVLDGAFFAFGLAFVSQQTVLPVFVHQIGGGNVAIGLIPVFWMLGFNLPQIFIAGHAQKLPAKKRLLLKTAFGQRLPWLLLGLLTLLVIPHVNAPVRLLGFFLLYGAAAAGGSFNLPVWFDMLAKMTPVALRGRLFAARLILGGLLGIVAGILVKRILDSYSFPASFALLFFLCFTMMMVSYYQLTILREPRGKRVEAEIHAGTLLRSLPQLLRRERNYRNFIIADALQYLAWMANAFFTVHALKKFTLTDSAAGTFTAIMMGSTILGNLAFGFLADHFGQRLNLILCALMMALACTLALLVDTLFLYNLVFVASAFALSLIQISRLPMIAELCREDERPTYVALASLFSSPFILAGTAGGWVADHFGYNPVFVFAGLCALAAAIWLAVVVQEPRSVVTKPTRME